MKLIPQEIVDKAAEELAYDSDFYHTSVQFFKFGVEFAIRKLENINIEFANWLIKNEYIPLQKLCWSKDSATYTSKTLFDKFLKERKL